MADLPLPHFLRFGGKAQIGIDLPLAQEADGLGSRMRDEVYVLTEVQAYIRRHAGEKDVSAGLQRRHGHRLPLQVADRLHAIVPEQLKAADMQSCQDDDGIPSLQAEKERSGEMPVEVGFSGCEGRRDLRRALPLQELHLG